ncbi:MAG: hypothetical protein MHM6MM_001465 [Cercozoa sp. M6MM]
MSNEAAFRQLCELLDADPLIDEFGVVPDLRQAFPNASVDSYVHCESHKLGMRADALPLLLGAAMQKFQELRNETLDTNDEAIEAVRNVTRVLLLLNADHYSSWNARKQCLLSHCTKEQLRRELYFTQLVLSRQHKSGDTWAHRRFVLTRLLPLAAETGELVRQEIALCERSCELYRRNYYAWTHRRWCVQHLASLELGESAVNELLRHDAFAVGKWLRRHVSDHSAVHHRVLSLVALVSRSVEVADGDLNATGVSIEPEHEDTLSVFGDIDCCSESDSVWYNELRRVVAPLILKFPGHVSLWYWARAAILHCSGDQRGTVIECFHRFVQRVFEDDMSANYEAQQRFASNTLRWLRLQVSTAAEPNLKLPKHARCEVMPGDQPAP